MQGRRCSWCVNCRHRAGFCTSVCSSHDHGDSYLQLGFFLHEPTHQHISLSSQPGVPGCNFKQQCSLMSFAFHLPAWMSLRCHRASLHLGPGRLHQEECPQKYLGKSVFKTVCGTRRVVSLRAETSETREGWLLKSNIKTHEWKGWKGTRFPSQQHRGELHQELSPSFVSTNWEMAGFPQS